MKTDGGGVTVMEVIASQRVNGNDSTAQGLEPDEAKPQEADSVADSAEAVDSDDADADEDANLEYDGNLFANSYPVPSDDDGEEVKDHKDFNGATRAVVVVNKLKNFFPRRPGAAREALVKAYREGRYSGRVTVWLRPDGVAVVLRGHTILEIAVEYGLDYELVECPAPIQSDEDAMLWMIDSQAMRLNLNKIEIMYFAGFAYNTRKQNSRECLSLRWRREGQTVHPDEKAKNRTDAKLGAMLNISPRTLRRCEKFYLRLMAALDEYPKSERLGLRNDILSGKRALESLEKLLSPKEPKDTENDRNEAICAKLKNFSKSLSKLMKGYTPDVVEWKNDLETSLKSAQYVLDNLRELME